MFSIICVYNNEKVLNTYLLSSLKNQDINYELILIDNSTNKFKSAADALNYGGKKAKGELLIFLHQDICLYENNLKDIEKFCNTIPNLGVAGVSGVSENKNGKNISNILMDIPPVYASPYHIDRVINTQTLDECLFIIPKKVFSKYKFDNNTCFGWHLYCAEYCLNLKNNDYNICILPITLYHASPGASMSIEYHKTLFKILKKYRNDYEVIYTTCLLSHNPKFPWKLYILTILQKFHIQNFLITNISKILKKIKS